MKLSEIKILFLGDSITEGFNTKQFLPELNIRNESVSGDSTVETFSRICSQWFEPQPDLIFLCIGTKDIARGKTDLFIVQRIDSILNKIISLSPHSKLILTSLFPTYNDAERPNQRIIELNTKLKELCNNKNLLYYDLHYHFTNKFGQLEEKFSFDGLHLTSEAYKHLAIKLSEVISLINTNRFLVSNT